MLFRSIPQNYGVAYRLVIARKDPLTQQVRYGEPSGRIVAYNTTAGTAYTTIQFILPPGTPPDAFIQVYRSLAAPPGVFPSDEMYLVTEIALNSLTGTKYWGYAPATSAPLIPNFISFNDLSPGRQDDPANAQIYVPLYVNRGLGNGAQSRKTPAPKSNVVGYFGGREIGRAHV